MFSQLKSVSAPAGLCALSIQANGIAFAHVVPRSGQKPALQICEYLVCKTDLISLASAIKSLVLKHKLTDAACCWILAPEDYKLLPLEPLPVEPGELSQALRWQIKDLLEFPVEDAAIEYFQVPIHGVESKKNALNVVVARKAYLQSVARLIRDSGLVLTSIDIAELALRNILMSYPEEQHGVGLLVLGNSNNKLIISRQGNLFLTRGIDLPLQSFFSETTAKQLTEDETSTLAALALEIQRSFDYYQSQLRQPFPEALFVCRANDALLNYLSPQFSCKVKPLGLKHILAVTWFMGSELQVNCLSAMGGALRKG